MMRLESKQIAESRLPNADFDTDNRQSQIGNRRCLWVTDGIRTRDVQDHNLALYQLSYGHR